MVLEDDVDLRRSIDRFLRADGFAVDLASSLDDADEKLAVNRYDALLFDRSVPGGDALDLLARWRSQGLTTPTLLVTAADSLADRVDGLRRGADDYLVKPFAMSELVARCHALCRRSQAVEAGSAPAVLCLGDLEVDVARREVRRAGRLLTLTAKEIALLRVLLVHAGKVVTRTELIERCWDENAEPMSNVVDVKIRQLRRKLGEPELIHTVRGAGYLAEERAETGSALP
jgi:two-component system copper resistance phosphate regulon response regulator CusR